MIALVDAFAEVVIFCIKNIHDSMIYLLYASQTGTTKDEAHLLSLQLKERGAQVTLLACEELEIVKMPEIQYCIFMVSTTGTNMLNVGQGDPPDNFKSMWNFLLIKTLPLDSLKNMKFSVFGFGDSSYEKFNWTSRKLYQRLIQLGATELSPRGLGDDKKEGGYFIDLKPWKVSLFEAIQKETPGFELDLENIDGLKKLPSPEIRIEFEGIEGKDDTQQLLAYYDRSRKNCSEVCKFKLTSIERISSPDHFQEIIKAGISNPPDIEFFPGDTYVIFPENSPSLVSQALSYLSLPPTTPLTFHLPPTRTSPSIPLTLPLSSYLSSHIFMPLSFPPSFWGFKVLSLFSRSQLHRDQIKQMDYASYHLYALRERRALVEVLQEFNVEPSIELMNLVATRTAGAGPRLYSWAGDKAIVAKVQGLTRMGRAWEGVASRWWGSRQEGDFAWGKKAQGSMHMVSDCHTPLFMVGPGTGVAPFLGLLEFRKKMCGDAMTRHKNYLVYGCRFKDKDFIERKFLEDLRDSGK